MNSRLAILIATVLAVLGLIVGLIIWSAREFRRVEAAVEALRGQSAQLSDQYVARVQALNVAFLRFELGGQSNDWNRYLEQGRELSTWLRAQQATPGLGEAERRSLGRVQDAYADYFQRVRLYGDSRMLGADRYPVKVARAELEVAVGNLLALGSELSNARQTRVDGLIQETRNALGRITILALVTVMGLLLLIGWQARELYRRHVAPLRLQMVAQSEQLERQEKIASLGLVAAGVAHEIRNPLAAVKARLFTLRPSVAGDASAEEDLDVIRSEIDRLEGIVRAFLQLARPPDPVLAEVAADAVLQGVADFLLPTVRAQGVSFRLANLADTPVRADADQLRQCLLNLVQNAAESMPQGGEVELGSWRESDPEGRAWVRLAVRDHGSGIAPEDQKRLFDPFFTTKPRGTGLGLALTRILIQRMGGEIRYQTQPGRGTTFQVRLPVSAG